MNIFSLSIDNKKNLPKKGKCLILCFVRIPRQYCRCCARIVFLFMNFDEVEWSQESELVVLVSVQGIWMFTCNCNDFNLDMNVSSKSSIEIANRPVYIEFRKCCLKIILGSKKFTTQSAYNPTINAAIKSDALTLALTGNWRKGWEEKKSSGHLFDGK